MITTAKLVRCDSCGAYALDFVLGVEPHLDDLPKTAKEANAIAEHLGWNRRDRPRTDICRDCSASALAGLPLDELENSLRDSFRGLRDSS